MASLKEVKNRISSVGNTRKITSAMKMVASSKLHRAGRAIEGMRPYEAHLSGIMSTFAATLDGEVTSPYVVRRPVKRSAIVVITSNSSLCGAFNNNVVKALRRQVEAYGKRPCRHHPTVWLSGKKEKMRPKLWASPSVATSTD